MIRKQTIEQARDEARRLARRGLTVYLYRMRAGDYWIAQAPPEQTSGWTGDLEYLEKVEAAC